MDSAADDLQIKLTVTIDEHPELHRILRAITEPRRRTRRLKDLAATGLLIERSGGLAVTGPAPAPNLPAEREPDDLLGDAVGVALWVDKAD
jgi:hypothetical protein